MQYKGWGLVFGLIGWQSPSPGLALPIFFNNNNNNNNKGYAIYRLCNIEVMQYTGYAIYRLCNIQVMQYTGYACNVKTRNTGYYMLYVVLLPVPHCGLGIRIQLTFALVRVVRGD